MHTRSILPQFKYASKFCILVLSLVAGTATMRADSVNFAGSVKGAFNGGVPASTASLNTINYYGSTFNDSTVANFLAIGGNPVANTSNFNNFGSISLGSTPAAYAGIPFELLIAFTAPTGIAGGQSSAFDATVFGAVNTMANGGIDVSFMPSSQMYTFANGTQTGSFTLHLNDVSVNAGQLSSVNGYITSNASVAVTPEPSSLLLLGTGLIGTASMMLRRRKLTA